MTLWFCFEQLNLTHTDLDQLSLQKILDTVFGGAASLGGLVDFKRSRRFQVVQQVSGGAEGFSRSSRSVIVEVWISDVVDGVYQEN